MVLLNHQNMCIAYVYGLFWKGTMLRVDILWLTQTHSSSVHLKFNNSMIVHVQLEVNQAFTLRDGENSRYLLSNIFKYVFVVDVHIHC